MYYAGVDAHAQYLRVVVLDKDGAVVSEGTVGTPEAEAIKEYLTPYRPLQVVVETSVLALAAGPARGGGRRLPPGPRPRTSCDRPARAEERRRRRLSAGAHAAADRENGLGYGSFSKAL